MQMKKGWKIFWTVIISLTGAGVVFCIIALCLGVTFSQFEKAYPNGIGIIRKDYVSFEEDWDDDDDDDEPEETENVVSEETFSNVENLKLDIGASEVQIKTGTDVKTTLLTGSVAVSNKSKSVRVILKPNEIAIYNKVEEKLTRKVLENVEDEISWRQGEFIFDDLPLQEIARELSNSFGATIHIADTALQNYRITARFRNGEDLTTILSVLHNAGYFDYSQNNKQIIITAKPDLK